jgi:hypothetical protein
MILSYRGATQTDKDNNFWANAYGMAEEAFIFGVTIGMFVFFVGLVFAARAKRYSSGYAPGGGSAAAHASHGE